MMDNHAKTTNRYFAKADVYRLLSACYYQPEQAFLEEELFGQMKTSMSGLAPGLMTNVSVLEDAFRAPGLDALKLDYSRLFLGPFDILAKPYGSVYLDGEKVVMGDSTVSVLEMYREGYFEIAEGFCEMPDHIAVELEFLYLLTFHVAKTTSEEERTKLLDLKQRFLDEHLGQWVTPLADAVRKGADTDFYQVLVSLTEQVVRDDLKEFAKSDDHV